MTPYEAAELLRKFTNTGWLVYGNLDKFREAVETLAELTPKRYEVKADSDPGFGPYLVRNKGTGHAYCIPTREAAERIAAIYEEAT